MEHVVSRAARDHTRIRQGETASDTVAKSAPPAPFVVGDRLARRDCTTLPTNSNILTPGRTASPR
eukprot:2704714-Prymnesium_polylepis.1